MHPFVNKPFFKCRNRPPAGHRAAIAALALALAPAAAASAVDDLQRFYREVQTFSAGFDQVVLDENLNRLEESTGTMWIARPGRFRWDYEPPLEQQIVGDGERVWIYDVELEQVTVRSMGAALGRSPAVLLAGEGDLRQNYEVADLGSQGRVDWVELTPRDSDSNFQNIHIGFEDGQLRLMELIDSLGQVTRIVLRDNRVNPDLQAERFTFRPPPGVDVIDESNL